MKRYGKPHHSTQFYNILIASERNPTPFSCLFPSPLPSSHPRPKQPLIYFISAELLAIAYEWNHTIYDNLWLYFFTYHNVLNIYLCCNKYDYFMPFKSQIILCSLAITYFLYPFISWCLFGLFPHVAFYESCESNLHGIKMSTILPIN